MSIVVNTTTSGLQRTIQVVLDTGEVERFALARRPDGGVAWRHDTFTTEGGAPGAGTWIAHNGRLTVAGVLARVPSCRREILEWTRNEIDDGADDFDLDIFSRAVRRDDLVRLEVELRAALGDVAASTPATAPAGVYRPLR